VGLGEEVQLVYARADVRVLGGLGDARRRRACGARSEADDTELGGAAAREVCMRAWLRVKETGQERRTARRAKLRLYARADEARRTVARY
jgi:hypothetical protein